MAKVLPRFARFAFRAVNSMLLVQRAATRFALPDVDFSLMLTDGEDDFANLPIWTYCRSVSTHQGVPVPDFTFVSFHRIDKGGVNSSFEFLLDQFSRMTTNASRAFATRKDVLFWRGSWAQTREIWMSERAHEGPGPPIDVKYIDVKTAKSESRRAKPRAPPVGLFDFCDYKYLLHMQGVYWRYSSRLKYLLLCGSTVFLGPQKFEEFYYSTLHGAVVHVQPNDLRAVLNRTHENQAYAENVARTGQQLALDLFQPQRIDEYLLMVAQAMADAGFVWRDAPLGVPLEEAIANITIAKWNGW